jgi:hypothetical protein
MSGATDNLFYTLKSCGVYNKIEAMYPFLGATANAHAINAIDSSTYFIQWNGGLTHNVSGVTGNGTNGYGNTQLKNTSLPLNDLHFSVFQNSQNTNLRADETQLGCILGGDPRLLIQTRNPVGGGVFDNTAQLGAGISMTTDNNGVSAACFIVTRSGTTTSTFFKNDTQIGTNTSTYTNGATPRDVYLLAMNLGGGVYGDSWSNNRLAFTTIGSGLTRSEVTCLNDAIVTFNNTLGRNFY